ncbi:MAG TPA: hypothetical protein VFX25_21700 [Streptosporangiaceae bacterium]|nr:hypothetical protein [Streptosporangiaceae bacterium]
MTAASFIASLVSSLAWPAVIVAILVIFHRQFGTMLDRLARVRLGSGGTEADGDWSQAEAAVRQSLAAARSSGTALPGGAVGQPGQPGSGRSGSGPAASGPDNSAGSGPDNSGQSGSSRGAGRDDGGSGPSGRDAAARQALIEDRWQALSGELRAVIARSDPAAAGPAGASFDQLLDRALRAGLLDSATVRSLDGLARLRTIARTSTGLTEKQAQEFGVLADALSYTMRRSGPPPGPVAPGEPRPRPAS